MENLPKLAIASFGVFDFHLFMDQSNLPYELISLLIFLLISL